MKRFKVEVLDARGKVILEASSMATSEAIALAETKAKVAKLSSFAPKAKTFKVAT